MVNTTGTFTLYFEKDNVKAIKSLLELIGEKLTRNQTRCTQINMDHLIRKKEINENHILREAKIHKANTCYLELPFQAVSELSFQENMKHILKDLLEEKENDTPLDKKKIKDFFQKNKTNIIVSVKYKEPANLYRPDERPDKMLLLTWHVILKKAFTNCYRNIVELKEVEI